MIILRHISIILNDEDFITIYSCGFNASNLKVMFCSGSYFFIVIFGILLYSSPMEVETIAMLHRATTTTFKRESAVINLCKLNFITFVSRVDVSGITAKVIKVYWIGRFVI